MNKNKLHCCFKHKKIKNIFVSLKFNCYKQLLLLAIHRIVFRHHVEPKVGS